MLSLILWPNATQLVFLHLFCFMAFCGALLLSQAQRLDAARFLLLFFGIVYYCIIATAVGPRAGVEFYVLIAACVPPLIFEKTERRNAVTGKAERRTALKEARASIAAEVLSAATADAQQDQVAAEVEELVRRTLRERTLDGVRADGRGHTDIRPIWGEVGWLPRCHGSAIFTRGETQALVSCTLGSTTSIFWNRRDRA